MAQTVGTRAGNAHRGDFLVTCAYCGAVWYRSVCRRNAAGQLICPDDQHIRDPVTLARLNAARVAQLRSRRQDGGSNDREALTTAGPLTVVPELVVAGWDAASITDVGDGGRVSSWPSAVTGGAALVALNDAVRPVYKTNGPSGRPYVAFSAHQLDAAAITRPAPATEPTFYWAIASRPRWSNRGFWWGISPVANTVNVALMNLGGEPWVGMFNANGGPPPSCWSGATGVNRVAPTVEFSRIEAAFTGSTADYLKIGQMTASGASAGDTGPATGFRVGSTSSPSGAANAWLNLAELWILKGVPPADQLALLDDYSRAKYGSAVLLPNVAQPIPPAPLEIMAGNIVAGWDAADLSAASVTAWPDHGPNGFTLTEATNPPSWSATGGPNNQPAVLFDGSNDVLSNSTLDLPPPGTRPTFYWAVMRQITWNGGRRLWSAGAGISNLAVGQAAGSPNIMQENGPLSNFNSSFTLSTYKRLEVRYANSTSDYVKVGATKVTGANAGNNDPASGWQFGIPGLAPSSIQVCEFWIFSAEPTGARLAALDAYVDYRYGTGLT